MENTRTRTTFRRKRVAERTVERVGKGAGARMRPYSETVSGMERGQRRLRGVRSGKGEKREKGERRARGEERKRRKGGGGRGDTGYTKACLCLDVCVKGAPGFEPEALRSEKDRSAINAPRVPAGVYREREASECAYNK
jgi:hypothetical protein